VGSVALEVDGWGVGVAVTVAVVYARDSLSRSAASHGEDGVQEIGGMHTDNA
jgi:hypothetical protein